VPKNEHVYQTPEELNKLLNTDRWLLRSGLVSDSAQDNLLLYGNIASVLVDDVEVAIDVNARVIHYWIYLKNKNLSKYHKFMKAWNKYKEPTTIWQKWRKLRLIKKSVYMNVVDNLSMLVHSYIPSYSVKIEVAPYGQTRQSEINDPDNN